jgi:hypothetical protein
MKRFAASLFAFMLCLHAYSGKVQLYLGASAGAGFTLSSNQLKDLQTGTTTVAKNSNTWSLHMKAEALLGLGRFRFGYRFLYNFTPVNIPGFPYAPTLNPQQYTTYFNGSRSNYFAQYGVLEYAIINTKIFALTPGIGPGSFTGNTVDKVSNDMVPLSAATHHRFTMSADLNAEIKIGRWTILFGPNYYLFSLQDKASANWHQYQNFIGGDVGFRVNLLKP